MSLTRPEQEKYERKVIVFNLPCRNMVNRAPSVRCGLISVVEKEKKQAWNYDSAVALLENLS